MFNIPSIYLQFKNFTLKKKKKINNGYSIIRVSSVFSSVSSHCQVFRKQAPLTTTRRSNNYCR